MRFYDREKELETLAQVREVAFSKGSQMTMLVGRRRIGKTKLMLKSCEGSPTIYLFVERNSEAVISHNGAREAAAVLNAFIPEGVDTFASLFETLMNIGKTQAFNLIVDEFQEFYYINEAVYSQVQDIWDRYKDSTHVNLLFCGSIYTLMHQIFTGYKEPLYGRCDCMLHLKPFPTRVLKQILDENKPDWTKEDLLALYTFTGGVPKYMESFVDNGRLSKNKMIDWMVRPGSVFLDEGRAMLIQEFGRKYGLYFSILSAIAAGHNTTAALADVVGKDNLGGHLKRLEEDYNLIERKRPVLSKPATKLLRYELKDLFLRFWFRYLHKYRYLVETEKYDALREVIKADYDTYSGLTLEMYFRSKVLEERDFALCGGWWQSGKETNEIDLVAVNPLTKNALVAEVKRQRKNFKPEDFARKVELLKTRELAGYNVETTSFDMEDM